MSETPLISTIIPLFNYEEYIEKCVNSILDQDYTNLQVIVVDNGSTDRSGEVVSRIEDPRLTILRIEDNDGWPPALNLGYEHAKGEWIHYFTADDALHPNFYSRLLEESQGGYDLIGSWMQPIDEEGNPDLEAAKVHDQSNFRDFTAEDYREFGWRMPMQGNSFIFRKAMMDQVMPVPKVIPADWVFVVRALALGIKGRVLEERLFDYRVHEGSLGAKMNQIDYLVHYSFVHLVVYRKVAAELNDRSETELESFQEEFEKLINHSVKGRPEITARLIAASNLGYDACEKWPDIKDFDEWVLRPQFDNDPAIVEFRRIQSLLEKIDDAPDTLEKLIEKFQNQGERLTRLRAELDRTKEKNRDLKERLGASSSTKKWGQGLFRKKE